MLVSGVAVEASTVVVTSSLEAIVVDWQTGGGGWTIVRVILIGF